MWFSFDQYNGEHLLHDTEAAAKKEAHDALASYRDSSVQDGWPEILEEQIGWGRVMEVVKETKRVEKGAMTDEEWAEEGYSDEWDCIIDYGFKTVEGDTA